MNNNIDNHFNKNSEHNNNNHSNGNNGEGKSELTSSTGGENDESSLDKIKEEKISSQLEKGELSNDIIDQIFDKYL